MWRGKKELKLNGTLNQNSEFIITVYSSVVSLLILFYYYQQQSQKACSRAEYLQGQLSVFSTLFQVRSWEYNWMHNFQLTNHSVDIRLGFSKAPKRVRCPAFVEFQENWVPNSLAALENPSLSVRFFFKYFRGLKMPRHFWKSHYLPSSSGA